jgi:hypothetical protein
MSNKLVISTAVLALRESARKAGAGSGNDRRAFSNASRKARLSGQAAAPERSVITSRFL